MAIDELWNGCGEKRLCGQFTGEITEDINDSKPQSWVSNSDMK